MRAVDTGLRGDNVSFGERHARCNGWDEEYDAMASTGSPTSTTRKLKTRLEVNILRTCRQIYEEASLSLWANNIFSFHSAEYFERWTKLRTATQLKKITKVHFDILWCKIKFTEWKYIMKLPHWKQSLSGLQTLHITFDQDYRRAALLGEDALDELDANEPLAAMRALDLKIVTCTIGNDLRLRSTASIWSAERKKRVAEEVRAKILGAQTC